MEIVFILEQVLNGLLVGVYYLLIALGLSLIFSLGGIVNLAHGAFYAIGAYLTVVLSEYVGFAGAFVAAPVSVGLIGMVVERFLFRRFYRWALREGLCASDPTCAEHMPGYGASTFQPNRRLLVLEGNVCNLVDGPVF